MSCSKRRKLTHVVTPEIEYAQTEAKIDDINCHVYSEENGEEGTSRVNRQVGPEVCAEDLPDQRICYGAVSHSSFLHFDLQQPEMFTCISFTTSLCSL